MRWVRNDGLPVPQFLEYIRQSESEHLLAETTVGVPASASE
jgi:aminoglycoside phosphotransferase